MALCIPEVGAFTCWATRASETSDDVPTRRHESEPILCGDLAHHRDPEGRSHALVVTRGETTTRGAMSISPTFLLQMDAYSGSV